MAAAENNSIKLAGVDKENEPITTSPAIPNSLESNTPMIMDVSLKDDVVKQERLVSAEDQNRSIVVSITENQDHAVDDIDRSVSSDPVRDQLANNKGYSKTQPAIRLVSNLSSSLSEGIERTDLLLSADHSHGLSSLSLEVMTSGDQLNLLADGLGSSQEGSLHSSEDNFLDEDEEVTKSRGSCASASDAPGCVEIENQCKCLYF